MLSLNPSSTAYCLQTRASDLASLSLRFFVYVHSCMLSCFSYVQLLTTPWTITLQAPLSMGLFRQEYWNGLPFPPPTGDLPNPGIKTISPMFPALAVGFFTTSSTWEAHLFPIIYEVGIMIEDFFIRNVRPLSQSITELVRDVTCNQPCSSSDLQNITWLPT